MSDFIAYVNDSAIQKLETFFELFHPENLRLSWPWIIFFSVLYSIVFVIGIVGNFLVILVYFKNSQMKSVPNLFVMNLAVADLLVILFCIPGNFIVNTFVPWIFGTFMCKAIAYVQGVSVFASAYILAAISADRCIAFSRPMQIAKGFSKNQALVTITVIWTFALLILIPWAVVFDVTTPKANDTTTFCIETWQDGKHGDYYFLFVNFLCCYFIPVVFICVFNFRVMCIVKRRKVTIESTTLSKTVENMQQQQNLTVTKTLFYLTFTFILNWLPLYTIICIMKFSKSESTDINENQILNISLPFAQLLGSSNSCINPVFYAFLNPKFRGMLQLVVKRRDVFTSNLTNICCAKDDRYYYRKKMKNRPSPENVTKNTTMTTTEQSASNSLTRKNQVFNQNQDRFGIKAEACIVKIETVHVQMHDRECENEIPTKFYSETSV